MADVIGVVGLALSIPGVVQACLKYYDFVTAALKDIRESDSEVDKFIVFLELTFSSLEESLMLVSRIDHTLEPPTRNVILRVLLELHTMLTKFSSKLENLYGKDGSYSKKVKFAFGLKADLEKMQRDIDAWNERLSRRLLLRGLTLSLAGSDMQAGDAESAQLILREGRSVQAPLLSTSHQPAEGTLHPIEASTIWLGKLPCGTPVTVEYRHYTKDSSFQERMFVKNSVRDVSAMLRKATTRADPQGPPNCKYILECVGYYADESRYRYGIASKLPITASLERPPRSLESLLQSPENQKGSRHDLNDRIVLARSIASAVLEVHSADFVHKSIRPSNILIFDPQEPDSKGYPYCIGHPAIVGFEETRPNTQESERLGSENWEVNIYRHPQRQGFHADVEYSMLHDIYSLGVIFLEIALWRSSTMRVKDTETGITELRHNPDFWGSLHQSRCKEGNKDKEAERIRSLYQKLARAVVPRLMGGRFASVINSCLSLGEQLQNKDDETVGLAYIEEVMEALESINL